MDGFKYYNYPNKFKNKLVILPTRFNMIIDNSTNIISFNYL